MPGSKGLYSCGEDEEGRLECTHKIAGCVKYSDPLVVN